MSCMKTWVTSMWLTSAATLALSDKVCQSADSCASSGLTLLQTSRDIQMKTGVDDEPLSGLLTMWSDSLSTIVGGSCEYANSALGGLRAPSATSPYVASRAYCAADSTLYQAGATCGACFRVTYDGSPATDPGRAGSLVIQVVDSGSAKTFDCQVDAFETITGARTGVFPVTYEPVECETQGDALATVLDGENAWYTKVIFSNLPGAVISASIDVDGKSFPMKRVSGATWSASPGGVEGAAGFVVTMEDGSVVELSQCFQSWPVPTGSSCAKSGSSPGPGTTLAATGLPTSPPSEPASTAAPAAPAAPTPAPASQKLETCADLCKLSPNSGTCSSHTDELSCTSHFSKSGTYAVPCSWTECGECFADGSGLLNCPSLGAQCGSE